MTIFIKTPEEIAAMREGGLILKSAQEAVKAAMVPGATLLELDKIAESVILKAGGVPGFKGYHGFPATLCTMVNSEIVHGIPDNRTLKLGDLVSVDCGVVFKGLNTDAAFTVIVGGEKTHPERARFSNCVKQALQAGCDQAIAGNYVGDIGNAIEAVIKKGGYRVVPEYTGHGVGRALHEDPHVYNYGRPKTGDKLVEGMTLAIEPIVVAGGIKNKTLKDGWTVVTKDGKDACQWEHCGVVTKTGFEIFV